MVNTILKVCWVTSLFLGFIGFQAYAASYSQSRALSQTQGSEEGISVSNILSTPRSLSCRDSYSKRRAALMNTPNLQTNCARKLEPEFAETLISDTSAVVVEIQCKPETSSSTGSVELVQEPSLDKPILAPGKMKTFFQKPAVRWALFVVGAALCTAGGFGGREVYRRYKAAQLLTRAPVAHVSLLSRLTAFLMRCKTALVG